MDKASVESLVAAIESQHGGRATLVQSVPIDERHDGKPVWQGIVHVFDLEGHPTATRAYAWSSPIEGSDKRAACAAYQLASRCGEGGDCG